MQRKLKHLLLIVLVPTILWGTVFFLIYRYWYEELPLLESIGETNIAPPFWYIGIILAIGYIFSILIGYYSVVYKPKVEKDLKFFH
jgi:hypothetical protein